MTQALLMGLLLGLAGSFHCVGMCGPLALSLPLSSTQKRSRLLSILSYNIGRTTTYFTLGACLGYTGSRLVVAGYQQQFSIMAGITVLLILVVGKYLPKISMFNAFQVKLKMQLARFLKKDNNAFSLYIFGILNGLLPCGLVYMAITSALIIGGALQSGIFMAAFGIGTLPLMALLMLTGHYISFSLRSKIKKAIPYFVGLIAILMILRGLNLGIPYISPAFSSVGESTHCAPTH